MTQNDSNFVRRLRRGTKPSRELRSHNSSWIKCLEYRIGLSLNSYHKSVVVIRIFNILGIVVFYASNMIVIQNVESGKQTFVPGRFKNVTAMAAI